jgi:hypothetical protein
MLRIPHFLDIRLTDDGEVDGLTCRPRWNPFLLEAESPPGHQKFSESQYGLGQNEGCTDNLAVLMTEIIKTSEEQNIISAVFLDT